MNYDLQTQKILTITVTSQSDKQSIINAINAHNTANGNDPALDELKAEVLASMD